MFITVFHYRYKLLVFPLVVVLLTGCASLDKAECLAGDWIGIGYADGSGARDKVDRFSDYLKDCSKHGVTPDRDAYEAGYDNGLRNKFCTYSSGVNQGDNIESYAGVCPNDLEKDFLKGYLYGLAEAESKQVGTQIEEEKKILELENSKERLEIILGAYTGDENAVKIEEYVEKIDIVDTDIKNAKSAMKKAEENLESIDYYRRKWEKRL